MGCMYAFLDYVLRCIYVGYVYALFLVVGKVRRCTVMRGKKA